MSQACVPGVDSEEHGLQRDAVQPVRRIFPLGLRAAHGRVAAAAVQSSGVHARGTATVRRQRLLILFLRGALLFFEGEEDVAVD